MKKLLILGFACFMFGVYCGAVLFYHSPCKDFPSVKAHKVLAFAADSGGSFF